MEREPIASSEHPSSERCMGATASFVYFASTGESDRQICKHGTAVQGERRMSTLGHLHGHFATLPSSRPIIFAVASQAKTRIFFPWLSLIEIFQSVNTFPVTTYTRFLRDLRHSPVPSSAKRSARKRVEPAQPERFST